MTSFVVPADYKTSSQLQKADSLFKMLNLRVQLNKRTHEATREANIQGLLGVQPGIPSTTNSQGVEDRFAIRDRVLAMLQKLVGNMATASDIFRRIEERHQIDTMNTYFPAFAEKYKLLRNITPVSFMTLWDRYLETVPHVPDAPPVPAVPAFAEPGRVRVVPYVGDLEEIAARTVIPVPDRFLQMPNAYDLLNLLNPIAPSEPGRKRADDEATRRKAAEGSFASYLAPFQTMTRNLLGPLRPTLESISQNAYSKYQRGYDVGPIVQHGLPNDEILDSPDMISRLAALKSVSESKTAPSGLAASGPVSSSSLRDRILGFASASAEDAAQIADVLPDINPVLINRILKTQRGSEQRQALADRVSSMTPTSEVPRSDARRLVSDLLAPSRPSNSLVRRASLSSGRSEEEVAWNLRSHEGTADLANQILRNRAPHALVSEVLNSQVLTDQDIDEINDILPDVDAPSISKALKTEPGSSSRNRLATLLNDALVSSNRQESKEIAVERPSASSPRHPAREHPEDEKKKDELVLGKLSGLPSRFQGSSTPEATLANIYSILGKVQAGPYAGPKLQQLDTLFAQVRNLNPQASLTADQRDQLYRIFLASYPSPPLPTSKASPLYQGIRRLLIGDEKKKMN